MTVRGRDDGGARTPEPLPETVADYRVVRLLGEASHGRLYLARPPGRLGLPDEYVVVKVFTARHRQAAYRRAVRELHAFAQVSSPYLVRILDAVLQEDFLYAMEFCPLGSLAAPARRPTRGQVLRAVGHAAHATHALHEAGLVHGAITPAAVLLTGDGGKLSDLGLARYLTPTLTVVGTSGPDRLEYLDPCLLRGEPPSAATDVYALGATLHRALTGRSLLGAAPDRDPVHAVRRVLAAEPSPGPGLTGQEAALIRSCVAPVGTRAATAEQVAQHLDRLVAELPDAP